MPLLGFVLSAPAPPRPNAPSLDSPADGVTMTLGGGFPATLSYNPSSAGTSPLSFVFERQILGIGVWQYWDVTNQVWATTAVSNPWTSATETITVDFPPGSWPDGSYYSWSAWTTDANGTSDAAVPDTIQALGAATVALTAPAGTVSHADPTFKWASTWPSGYQQAGFEIVVEEGTAAGATAPGTGTTLYDSGLVSSGAASALPPLLWDEGAALTAWVQLTGTDSLVTNWAYADFTCIYAPPDPPTLTATATTFPATGAPCVNLSAGWSVADLGPSGNWQASVTFYFSEDELNWYQVRNDGQQWFDAATGTSGTATCTDHEATPGVDRYYRAVLAFYGTPTTDPPLGAIKSTSSTVLAVTTTNSWWLKHLTNPALTCVLSLQRGDLPLSRQDPQAVNQIIGRSDPIVLSDVLQLPTITLPIVFTTQANYEQFLSLRQTQSILRLEGPAPAGAWYVRLGQETSDTTNLSSLRYGGGINVARALTLNAQAVASAGNGYMIGTSGAN